MTANSANGEPAPHGPPSEEGGIPADTFANRLILSRAHAGHLSIREAADLCGLGRGAWTNWERGALPQDQIDVAEKVSKGLGMDFRWLLLGGTLLPARGRPVKRSRATTSPYPPAAVRPMTPRTDGRPRGTGPGAPASAGQPVRRARLVDRTQSVGTGT